MPESTKPPAKPLTKLDAVRRIKPDDLRRAFVVGEARFADEDSVRLMEREKEAWKEFLGMEINIPAPPENLLTVQKKIRGVSYPNFAAHYLPEVRLEQDTPVPGRETRFPQKFWRMIEEGKLAGSSGSFPGRWILVDTTQRDKGPTGVGYGYSDDRFKRLIETMRDDGKLTDNPHDHSSRLNIGWYELELELFPHIAKVLGIEPNNVRCPRFIEYWALGNMHYPEWFNTHVDEWLEDEFEDNTGLQRLTASPVNRTLLDFSQKVPGSTGFQIGFRPMIVFPN